MGIYETLGELLEGATHDELYENGNLHIKIEPFIIVRDKTNLLVGSINNWLENKSHEKSTEIVVVFADLLNEYSSNHEYDLTTKCLFDALLNGKIGYTEKQHDGSFCISAYQAYIAFHIILSKMVKMFNVPIARREMPSYPTFDSWVIDGFLKNADNLLAHVDDSLTDCQDHSCVTEQDSEEAKKKIDELFQIAAEAAPRIEAFRKKVTSSCKICKSLDDACQKSE